DRNIDNPGGYPIAAILLSNTFREAMAFGQRFRLRKSDTVGNGKKSLHTVHLFTVPDVLLILNQSKLSPTLENQKRVLREIVTNPSSAARSIENNKTRKERY